MILKVFSSKKRSIFMSWLLSYSIILLIAIVIGAVIYIQAENLIEDEINRSSISILKQIQTGLDSKLQDVEMLAQQIAFNTRINGFMQVRKPVDASGLYLMTQIRDDLTTYGVTNKFMDSFFIYFKNSDLILSSNGYYTKDLFYDSVLSTKGGSSTEWDKIMSTTHARECFLMQKTSPINNGQGTLVYAQSLPLGNSSDSSANIVILLDEARIINISKNSELDSQMQFSIIDTENRILASSQVFSDQSELKYSSFDKNEGIVKLHINGRDVVATYTTSENFHWKYINVIPSQIFAQKVNFIKKLTILGLLLMLMVGGAAAYLLAKRNYLPIRRLISSFMDKTALGSNVVDTSNERYSEYQTIHDYVYSVSGEKEKFKKENSELFIKLEKQNKSLRSNILLRLLKGKGSDSSSIEDVLLSYDIKFRGQYFAVLLFNVDDFVCINNESKSGYNSGDEGLVNFAITNVVEELASREHGGYMVEIDDMLACILNLYIDDTKDAKILIEQIVSEARDFLSNKLKIKVTASISNVNIGIGMLAKAYEQAMEAMEYKIISGSDNIIHYEDVCVSNKSYYYPINMEQQLMNSIKSGNLVIAREVLEEIFRYNLTERKLSTQMAKCLMFELINTVIKTLDEISTLCDQAFIEKLDMVGKLLKCDTFDQMKHQILEMSDYICEYINKIMNTSQNETLKNSILKHIEENYSDLNLCVSSIADEFKMSPVTMSRFFKDHTSQSLLDYINIVRLEKAKELLIKTQDLIVDIAIKTGYCNSNTFIRAFKKYEHITPGKFKEISSGIK